MNWYRRELREIRSSEITVGNGLSAGWYSNLKMAKLDVVIFWICCDFRRI